MSSRGTPPVVFFSSVLGGYLLKVPLSYTCIEIIKICSVVYGLVRRAGGGLSVAVNTGFTVDSVFLNSVEAPGVRLT